MQSVLLKDAPKSKFVTERGVLGLSGLRFWYINIHFDWVFDHFDLGLGASFSVSVSYPRDKSQSRETGRT